MSQMSNADLSELLRRHGVRESWPKLTSQTTKYNERFMNLPPGIAGTPEGARLMEEQAAKLYNPETKGGLKRMTRRTQERYTTTAAIDGDPNAILSRVVELDDATCDGCESLAGFEGTIADHEGAGLPGEQECGGMCRCQLIRVEGGGAEPAGPLKSLAEGFQQVEASLAAAAQEIETGIEGDE